ncbi:MAG: carboxymuconolactone decarboxylase family protein [Acidimicrobiales bacterium]
MASEVSARWESGRAAYASQFRTSPEEAEERLSNILGSTMAEGAILAAGGTNWDDNCLTRIERCFIAVAAMVSIGGVEPRLRSYVRWALDLGGTSEQLEALVSLLATFVGYPRASVAMEVVKDVIATYDGGDGRSHV